jgi:hypothetical protein
VFHLSWGQCHPGRAARIGLDHFIHVQKDKYGLIASPSCFSPLARTYSLLHFFPLKEALLDSLVGGIKKKIPTPIDELCSSRIPFVSLLG